MYLDDVKKAANSKLPWDCLSGKNILVVGATGMIGSCIVDVLMMNENVDYHVYASGRNKKRAMTLFSQYESSAYFHFIEYDVCTPLMADIDFHYVIDAASGANPIEYSKNPVGVIKANILGVEHLLSYGKDHNIKRFVYVSSGDVYGECKEKILNENMSGYVDPLKVRSCYPASKRAAEALCVAYSHQYGLNVSIARPCHTFGPHFTNTDTRAYAQFIRNIVQGEDIVMKSNGEQYRSWCYVVDCALGILFVMLKGENGEAYNIADDNAVVSIKTLAETIATIGKKQIIFDIPSDAEKMGYNPACHSVFTTERLKMLGWTIEGTFQEKMLSTVDEAVRKNNVR